MAKSDELEILQQGDSYNESEIRSKGVSDVDKLNSEMSSESSENNVKRGKRTVVKNPFGKDDSEESGSRIAGILSNKRVILTIAAIVLVIIIVVVIFATVGKKDEGAEFLQHMDEYEEAAFTYSSEEREQLRQNGYTADDIERYELEERNPSDLISLAEERREALYETEVKPYLDGASDEFKWLQSMTWVGTGKMPDIILEDPDNYSSNYGTYNCDYVKIPAHGSQLFLKLTVLELGGQEIFMTIKPNRYNQLDAKGNLVVNIDYQEYPDGSILVYNVEEVDIRS